MTTEEKTENRPRDYKKILIISLIAACIIVGSIYLYHKTTSSNEDPYEQYLKELNQYRNDILKYNYPNGN